MKLLVAIQNTFPGVDCTVVFTYAWRNFVQRYRDRWPGIEFVFVNNGLPAQQFDSILTGYKTVHVPLHGRQFLWDTDTTYCPYGAFYKQYDFIMRIDNDALPVPENLDAIYTFLSEHPEVDFVSATNYCRQIDSLDTSRPLLLDNRTAPSKVTWSWEPWGYPTTNSDMYIIKSSFFEKCLQKYYACNVIVKPKPPFTPFDTHSLRYKDICSILGHTETRFDVEQNNVQLRIDGGINTDFWTILCSLKPVMAGVVNFDNRSFQYKNHLLSYGKAIQQSMSYHELIDPEDNAWHHTLKVQAPYFHMGNAYVTAGLFYPSHYLNIPNIIQQFSGSEVNPTAVLQYHLVDFFSQKACTDTAFYNRLHETMNQWFVAHGINKDRIDSCKEGLISYYQPVFQHYVW